jgi:hypothetical protein
VAAAAFAQNGAIDVAAVRKTLLSQNALLDRDAMPEPISIG